MAIFSSGEVLTAANLNAALSGSSDSAHRSTDQTLAGGYSGAVDGALDVTVTAEAGDAIQYTYNSYMSAGTNITSFAPYTWVSAATVSALVPIGVSFNPWFIEVNNYGVQNMTCTYKTVAGDISGGTVTVRLFVVNAASRQISHSSTGGIFVSLVNLGPDD